MRTAVRPSSALIDRQPSRSYPSSVSINRRTSVVGARFARKVRRLARNSSCSLEKLNFINASLYASVETGAASYGQIMVELAFIDGEFGEAISIAARLLENCHGRREIKSNPA